ncbi:tetratricopeptide repeat protein [Mucilaginibacter sp.]|uniref:tetratricopeptide repeat protein n=1 Tax=Mucilaginibacter sp. TaxID=1882438 RepID=UPI003D14BBC9
MKYLKCLLMALFLVVILSKVKAQNAADAHTLIKEGIALNDAKKYTEAISKYTEALKLDTGNLLADYQMALSLYGLNKGTDGLPYLQKVIKGNSPFAAAAYDLSGLICFRNKQYAEAEKYAVEAIKLDPKHAGSQRMYALVCFHQNKRAAALLGFCSFILLEPNTVRSTEALGNIQHILQGGALKPEPGEMASHAVDAANNELNHAITKAVAEMASRRRYASPADLLAAQLKAIFINIGTIAGKQNNNDFFSKYLAAYFYQLAQSPNMPAFARFINSANPDNAKWIKDNPQQMTDLDNWIKATARDFN